MDRDDVIRMATSANILEPLGYECPHRKSWRDDIVRGLERFAALVAAHERESYEKMATKNGQRSAAYYFGFCDGHKSAMSRHVKR